MRKEKTYRYGDYGVTPAPDSMASLDYEVATYIM